MIEVPLALPLDAKLPEEEDEAEALLDDAQALVESYGVRAVTRLLRARRAGPAIVEEARRRDAELVVLGAPRAPSPGGRRLFGGTVDYVLREAPCRVLVAAGKRGGMRRNGTVAISAAPRRARHRRDRAAPSRPGVGGGLGLIIGACSSPPGLFASSW